nr:MAG TPA: nucelotide kinase [Caudoviricetes sp.]
MNDKLYFGLNKNKHLERDKSVDSPVHYTSYNQVEIIEITRWLPFDLGNAVKYIARAGLKDPEKEDQDLLKALWYVDDHIEKVESRTEVSNPRAVMNDEMTAIFEWKVRRLCDQLSYDRSLAVMAIVNGHLSLASKHIESEYLKVHKGSSEEE